MAPALSLPAASEETFFTLAQRKGRWWFVTPEGKPFFSIALNHIDPAPLRYAANGDLWTRKYGNSMERWLKESVAPDLREWGFNSVGWTQEDVTRGQTNHRHSRAFTFEEYQWLGLPYCRQLSFADFHQWEVETRHPDFHSAEFAEWCDYVARDHCARMAGDSKLIGYSYIDCPTWIHTRPHNEWKGPLFDPEKLKTDAGRRETPDTIGGPHRASRIGIPRRLRNLGPDVPGKQAYVRTVRKLYRERIEDFNTTYGTTFKSFDALAAAVDWPPRTELSNAGETRDNIEFLHAVVHQYYRTAKEAIRRYDPNHLSIGTSSTATPTRWTPCCP
jgi:hypothetical protein